MADEKTTDTAVEPKSLRIGSIRGPEGARKAKMRVGRGHGSGKGKTAGRGIKGQKARNRVRRGFEGGQTPLQRRLPRLRGISQAALHIGRFRKEYAVINVGRLDGLFESGAEVTPEALVACRAVRKLGAGLRVLGVGEITKPLKVKASHVSESAKAKIEAAGGSVELI